MAKMTPARARRWSEKLAKMQHIYNELMADMGDAKVNSSGSVNGHVIAAAADLVPIGDALIRVLADGGPVYMTQQRLEDAAQARKDAAARKAQERAANPGASDERDPDD